MKVEINLYATLSKYLSDKSRQRPAKIDIETGTRVRDLLQRFNVPSESVKLIFINGVHAEMDAVLKDGDRIGVFPPVGGG